MNIEVRKAALESRRIFKFPFMITNKEKAFEAITDTDARSGQKIETFVENLFLNGFAWYVKVHEDTLVVELSSSSNWYRGNAETVMDIITAFCLPDPARFIGERIGTAGRVAPL